MFCLVSRGELAPYPATDAGSPPKTEKSKTHRSTGPHCASNARKKGNSKYYSYLTSDNEFIIICYGIIIV